MYLKAVNYKGMWLAPGSRAFALYEERRFSELQEHLKQVNENEKKLLAGIDSREADK